MIIKIISFIFWFRLGCLFCPFLFWVFCCCFGVFLVVLGFGLFLVCFGGFLLFFYNFISLPIMSYNNVPIPSSFTCDNKVWQNDKKYSVSENNVLINLNLSFLMQWMELKKKKSKQCNIVANYAIVTILMAAFRLLRHSEEKSFWKVWPFSFTIHRQYTTKYNITLRIYLYAGESIKLKQKCKDSGEPLALQYSSVTLPPNV